MKHSNKIHVKLKRSIDDSYDIVIGASLFPEIAGFLSRQYKGRRFALITDSNLVKSGQSAKLLRALARRQIGPSLHVFQAGEKSKTLSTCTTLLGQLGAKGYGRDTVVLALGGGVVGDMAGLVAALHTRGVPYIQMPTTTVSQADSSIGGKTGVDTQQGKNLVGIFKQPARVFIDVEALRTLPNREYISGLAETVKHAVIRNKAFFAFLEQNADKIKTRDPKVLQRVARENCKIKGYVVERDPEEKGMRRILNYGHTIGHALERETNYRLLHGECIAIGMMVAGKIAELKYGFPDLARQKSLLRQLGLPVRIPAGISNERLLKAAAMDKKAVKNTPRFSLPSQIGTMLSFGGAYVDVVYKSIILRAIDDTR